jgi:hypothetical protein
MLDLNMHWQFKPGQLSNKWPCSISQSPAIGPYVPPFNADQATEGSKSNIHLRWIRECDARIRRESSVNLAHMSRKCYAQSLLTMCVM